MFKINFLRTYYRTREGGDLKSVPRVLESNLKSFFQRRLRVRLGIGVEVEMAARKIDRSDCRRFGAQESESEGTLLKSELEVPSTLVTVV